MFFRWKFQEIELVHSLGPHINSKTHTHTHSVSVSNIQMFSCCISCVSNLIIPFFSQGPRGPRGIKGAPGDRGPMGERVSEKGGDRCVLSIITPVVCVCRWICKCLSFFFSGSGWCSRKWHRRLSWFPGK